MKFIKFNPLGSSHQRIYAHGPAAAPAGAAGMATGAEASALEFLAKQSVGDKLPVTTTVLDFYIKAPWLVKVLGVMPLVGLIGPLLSTDFLINMGKLTMAGMGKIEWLKTMAWTRDQIMKIPGLGKSVLEKGANFTRWYLGEGVIFPIARTTYNSIAALLGFGGQSVVQSGKKLSTGLGNTLRGGATFFTKGGRKRLKEGLHTMGEGVMAPIWGLRDTAGFAYDTVKDNAIAAAAARAVAWTSTAGWEGGTEAVLEGAQKMADAPGPIDILTMTRGKMKEFFGSLRPGIFRRGSGAPSSHAAPDHGAEGGDHGNHH